jgi:7-cyano-7-deazaguanine synthase
VTVLLYSGGLDSTVLLYDLRHQGHDVLPVGFDYGQRHIHELTAARNIAQDLRTVRLPREIFLGSSLTQGEGVVVPNRNMVFLSVGAAIAVGQGHDAVAIACTADDYDTWPDCRPEFLEGMNGVLRSIHGVGVLHPYTGISKKLVALRGENLGAPIHDTWSCYSDGPEPCGQCLACKARQAALA